MNDVRKSVEDVAYTAVGVGVLGAQAVVAKGQQAKGLVDAQTKGVRTTAKTKADDAKAKADETTTKATDAAKGAADDAKVRFDAIVQDVRERVEPVLAKISDAVEPVFEQIQAKAGEVVEVGTAKARTLLGRSSTPEATPTKDAKKASAA
jgi:vacuolar-type H+-ATPase subunit H